MRSERVDVSAAEKYALLPPFWHVMTSGEKQLGLNIIARCQYKYTVEYVQELHTSFKVILSDVNDLRVCLLLARGHPEMF